MTLKTDNVVLLTDSYKFSHYKQYPPKTTGVYSYFEARKGAKFPATCFFGLQYILKRYLSSPVTREDVDTAQSMVDAHVGPGVFNRAGWDRIVDKFGGRLPIRIKAVKEGTVVPVDNVLMTVENTDPESYWLTNYLETLLVQVWYPSTVATLSRSVKQTIREGLLKTGDVSLLPFKLHDFGFRGVSSVESAGIGGLAHLVNFKGTDTAPPLVMAKLYYGADMAGFSIPASEHSTITSWGRDGEAEAFANMLEKYPTGLVACVSDSYDIGHACSDLWGGELRDQVLARKGTLVVRPDSGDIVTTVLDVLERLQAKFGTRVNDKGFHILDDHVRVIQGDGCTPDTIAHVVNAMVRERWSIDNIAFGMGGGLLQKVDRDTQRFAFKCSNVTVDGEDRDVWKAPVTDMTKKSKAGRLVLQQHADGSFTTEREAAQNLNLLELVYEDGVIKRTQTLDEIRALAEIA